MTPWSAVLRDLMNPATDTGALAYAVAFFLAACLLARAVRLAVRETLAHDDWVSVGPTAALFLAQLAQIGIFILAFTYYAHVIPGARWALRSWPAPVSPRSSRVGGAEHAGQHCRGGSLLMYRPFRVHVRASHGRLGPGDWHH